jgi:hypothetical protein
MDLAALKFLLDEINRRFDEADARVNRLFDKLQQPAHLLGSSPSASFDLPTTPLSVDHFSDASASVPATPAAAVEAVVIVDNWGRCFDDGEQYCTTPSIVVDNWGGFFGGEDLDLPGNTSFPCNSESGVVPTKALVTSTDPNVPLGCNALNLVVEFFSSFLSPNSGVTLFSLSCFASFSQFQTSIAAGVRVMYKPKPKCHGCCIMPKHISLSDVECSSRSVLDFDSRCNSV